MKRKIYTRSVQWIKETLSGFGRSFRKRKKKPDEKESSCLRCVEEAVAVPESGIQPFCTAAQPPSEERQAEVAGNAAELVTQLEQLAGRCEKGSPCEALLRSVIFYSEKYSAGCAAAAAEQKLVFAVYKKQFECLLNAITGCTMFLANLSDPDSEYELPVQSLTLIREHLAFAGVHTVPLDIDGPIDYDNIEAAYLIPTDDPEKNEHIGAIISPAYFLGASRLCFGSAACFELQKE